MNLELGRNDLLVAHKDLKTSQVKFEHFKADVQAAIFAVGRAVFCADPGSTSSAYNVIDAPRERPRPNLVLPIIHMNGTSKAMISEELCEAYSALGEAYEKMKRAAPNGRDYYVEPGLLQKAEEQHRRRLQVIHDLREELETEVQQLDEKYPDAR